MEFIRENILKIVIFLVILIVAIIIFSLVFSGGGTKSIDSYSQMEENLVKVVKEYLNDNTKLIPKNNGEITKVNVDTLVSAEYMDQIHSLEEENVTCSGYVDVINKNDDYSYIPYIKCGNYYETKTIADYIKDNASEIIDGDGLYKIGEKYVFRGENPNNYLKLGERIYRIIEINENNELKLISTERYNDRIVWDNRYNIERDKNDGINDFSKSRLKDSLVKIYNDTEFFLSQEKEKIIAHNICIGKRLKSDSSIDGSTECSAEYPDQYVSMIQLNEYARASVDPNCKTVHDKACSNYNYIKNIESSLRTITAVADNTYQFYYISNGVATVTSASRTFYVYPVVYIDELSIYTSGDGTLENPYIVK